MKLLSSRFKSYQRPYNYLIFTQFRIVLLVSFLYLCLSTSFLFWISTSSEAQEGNTVSGRLIDTNGNPISDIVIYLRLETDLDQNSLNTPADDSVRMRTDSKGRFAFSNIHYKVIDFDIDSHSKIGFEINVLSYEFGEITLYPFRRWHWSSVNFALDSGAKMENIVITADIRKRPKLTTRVVYADGTPVTNSSVYILRETKSLYRRVKGDSRGDITTDLDGYFTEYLSVDYPPRFYVTLAIEHQGLYAKTTPFIMVDDVDLVLKLNGNPGAEINPIISNPKRYSALEALLEPPPMWIGNQTSGHVYKITKSQTIEDAMQQAEAEGAYLLSINDRSEEVWLRHIYGNERIWIGLSDAEEEGKWKWHSGEPVTYTNWSPYHPENGNTEARDYVMTGYVDWRWKVVGKSFGRTILEKPSMQFISQPK